MLYSEWDSTYFALYKRRLRPQTRASYARIDALLLPLIGGLTLEELTPDTIQRALLRVEREAGPRQAQIAYALLHASLARAVRSEHLMRNPCDAVDKPEHQPRPGRALSAEEWAAALPYILDEPGLALAALAGLRRCEVLAIQRRDIDFTRELIHVHQQRQRIRGEGFKLVPPKSAAGIRDVPLVPELAAVLKPAVRPLLPNAFVCPYGPEALDERWKRAQSEAGISGFRLHDLRHTWASRLIAAGCSPRILQYAIGHSAFTLTSRVYVHISPLDAANEFRRCRAAFQ